MDALRYQSFLDHLVAVAEEADEVVGLVVLGSGASRSRTPDAWSDHDVWLVTRDGAANAWRSDVSWLPDPERIVGHFVETAHGRSIVYDDGHLLELAVFDDRELEVVRVNEYRVLYDIAGVAGRIASRAQATAAEAAAGDPVGTVGRFVTQILIGLGRLGRGERLSAHQLIRGLAVESLLRAMNAAHIQPVADVLDDLDPHRRVEVGRPEQAASIDRAVGRPLVEAATELVSVAEQLLAHELGPASDALIGALHRAIDRARAAQPDPPALHHVQLAIPPGGEEEARRFYGSLLGLAEVAKPAVLEARGGCWFAGPSIELHLGVEDPFRPARRAHPGILTGDLDGLAGRLEVRGHEVRWDPHLPGHRRFYTDDPFGNRLEFLQPG